jgi:uncharacterized membrane protein YccC
MTARSQVASPPGQQQPRQRHRWSGLLPREYWRVSWSAPAALRALRACLVVPPLFAITFKVIGDPQMTVFAVFGGFGALVFTSFGGTRRDKAIAHLGLAVAGSLALIIGTLVSGSTWLAGLVTIPVAFGIFFAGVAGPNAGSGVTACLLAYVLPVATAAPASTIPSRLAGWWLGSAVSTIAVLLIAPRRTADDRLRTAAAGAAAALARQLSAAIDGNATEADRTASVAAKHSLMDAFAATPNRPVGLAAAAQGLASLSQLLEWCTSLITDSLDGHLDLRDVAAPDKQLLAAAATALGQMAELLKGKQVSLDVEPVWQARQASAAHLRSLTGEPAAVVRSTDHAFHAQAIGVAVSAAAGDALIAVGRASPKAVAAHRQRWLSLHHVHTVDPPQHRFSRIGGIIAADASLRSVWFRNSARGAAALAIAVIVAQLLDVQHAFWVVLGTLSVLRTNAAGTGATALRALAGTTLGFVVGAALLLGIGTNPVVLWIAFPLAVLVAGYAPGTAPFVVGQAAFTVTVVVLFNLLVPAGWKVGLLRIEDVAIGCAVSIVVGALFWPRGASSVVGDNLADAFRSGASYLGDAASWALGESTERPERAMAAIAAGIRLDDAVRGYLSEQGSKRLSKHDMWTLVMAAMRLRLTAHSLASLPGHNLPPPEHGDGIAARLLRQAGELTGFYERVAAEVSRPAMGQPAPPLVQPPAPVDLSLDSAEMLCTIGPAHYHPEALWVGHHLSDLAEHDAAIPAPAASLARLRRTPWWRAPAEETAPARAAGAAPAAP